jgi:hypothetical protein
VPSHSIVIIISYLEDSPRVVLVVGNATIAHSPLRHDRVETHVGE